MPTQVFVTATPEVQSFLGRCKAKEDARKLEGAESVELDQLYRLAEEHSRRGGSPVRVHELLAGAEVVSRREAKAAPVSELERMRLESEERRYQGMVKGVAPLTKLKKQAPAEHQRGLKFATNFATQVVVAFIGAFLLGYFFVETFVVQDYTTQVLAGAFCSFLTLLLETCLLVVHEHKEELINERRRAREEKARRLPVIPAREGAATASGKPGGADAAAGSAGAEGAPAPAAEAAPKPAREKKQD